MKTKYALVLSGGGFNGAFQLGALNYLRDNWHTINPDNPIMKFEIIAGVSTGALNGSLMAMDKQRELNEFWKKVSINGVEEVYTSDFIDTKSKENELKFKLNFEKLRTKFLPDFQLNISLWNGLGMLISKKKRKRFLENLIANAEKELQLNFKKFKSIADNTPLRNKLTKILDINKVKSKFLCGFVSLDSGEYHAVSSDDFNSNEDFVKGVLASTSVPMVWTPVEEVQFKNRKVCNVVDGGVKNVSPLGDVIKLINQDNEPDTEYVIIVINCNSGKSTPKDYSDANIAGIGLRSLQDIALTEVFNNDIDMFMKINKIVEQVERKDPMMKIYSNENRSSRPLKSFRSIVIQPDEGVLGDSLLANQNLIAKRMTHGDEKAREGLKWFEYMKRDELVLA